MTARANRLVAALALVAFASLLGACGGGAPVAAPSTTTSTTTTTTLPTSIGIALTTPSGALSFLGPVSRVSVATPTLGAITLPPQPTGLGETLPSVKIAYRRFGSGPSLVLVMGEHGTMTWWDPQLLSLLAQRYRVTIFDLPGVGYSGPLNGPASLQTYADLTAGLIVALGIDVGPVTLLGWGLGGDVALEALVRHPKIATDLVLVDTPAPGRLNVAASSEVSSAFAEPSSTTIRLSHLMFPAATGDARAEWIERVYELPPDDETAAAVAQQAEVASSVASQSALAAAISGLRIPVRVVNGDDDVVSPPENAANLVSAIPHATALDLKGEGYAGFVDKTPELLALLQRLTKGQPAGP